MTWLVRGDFSKFFTVQNLVRKTTEGRVRRPIRSVILSHAYIGTGLER